MKIIHFIAVIGLSLGVISCAGGGPSVPEEALRLTTETAQIRQLQTKSFEAKNINEVLSSGVGVMQDFGIKITSTDKDLGLIIGEKQTDATHYGEIAGSIALTVLAGALGSHQSATWSDTQKLRASLFIRPVSDKQIDVRVTFQNIVWDNHGQVTSAKSVEDPAIYKDFFDKLSKAAFLEEYKL